MADHIYPILNGLFKNGIRHTLYLKSRNLSHGQVNSYADSSSVIHQSDSHDVGVCSPLKHCSLQTYLKDLAHNMPVHPCQIVHAVQLWSLVLLALQILVLHCQNQGMVIYSIEEILIGNGISTCV